MKAVKIIVFTIMTFFILAAVTEQASYAMNPASSTHPQVGRKRAHCKIDIVEMIMYALEFKVAESGLIWMDPHKTFAMDADKFTSYYQKMGNSSAKVASIKNRLTKSKSGFIHLESQFPPGGYSAVYTYKDWLAPYASNLPGESENRNPSSSPPFDNILLTPENYRDDSTESAVISPTNVIPLPSRTNGNVPASPLSDLNQFLLNPEVIPVTILKERKPSGSDQYFFKHDQFLADFKKLESLKMDDFDKNNFETLLVNEENPNSNGFMSTSALHVFGVRFGPWERIVPNVRRFVDDGAKEWFYGKCDTPQAEAILRKNQIAKEEHYLIRSITIDEKAFPDHVHVFSISHINTAGRIIHHRILKNAFGQLCMLGGRQYKIICFDNFKEIIERAVKKDAKPIAKREFESLVLRPSRYLKTYEQNTEYSNLDEPKEN